MIANIVCAVDGSEHSDKSVALASDLASRYGAELFLVHVFMRGLTHEKLAQFSEHAHLKDIVTQESERVNEYAQASPLAFDGVYIPPPSGETITRLAQIILEDAARLAASKGAENVRTATLDGEPAKAILDFAQEHDADFVVLGSRGLGAVRSLLLGSTSHEVSHRANCTCITVK